MTRVSERNIRLCLGNLGVMIGIIGKVVGYQTLISQSFRFAIEKKYDPN